MTVQWTRCSRMQGGRGLGRAFLDQDFQASATCDRYHITGTVYLIHKVGNDMRRPRCRPKS